MAGLVMINFSLCRDGARESATVNSDGRGFSLATQNLADPQDITCKMLSYPCELLGQVSKQLFC